MENMEVKNQSSNKKLYFLGGLGAFIIALLCLPKKNHVQVTNINIGNLSICNQDGKK